MTTVNEKKMEKIDEVEKTKGKRERIKALAFVLAAGMLLQPASVNASSEEV